MRSRTAVASFLLAALAAGCTADTASIQSGPAPDLSGQAQQPYVARGPVAVTARARGFSPGCGPVEAAGLLDRFAQAANRGDTRAIEGFFGRDFSGLTHPADINLPANPERVADFLSERASSGERWRLVEIAVVRNVGVDATHRGTAEFAAAFEVDPSDMRMPRHLVFAGTTNCHKQTFMEVGFRAYDTENELRRDPHCPPSQGPLVPNGAIMACSRAVESVPID